MGYLFVPGMEELSLDSTSHSETPTELSVVSNGKPMQRLSSWKGWLTKPFMKRLFGTTSKPSTANRIADSWISSLADTRASHSLLLESGSGPTMSGTFGLMFLGLYEKYSRDSASSRTSSGTLLKGIPKLEPTLKQQATELRQDCTARLKLGQTMRGSDSSSWPTPTTQDAANNGGASQMKRNSFPLNAQVGGSLNPTWVEWLMGLPLGWTDLEPLETESYQSWQQKHLSVLRQSLQQELDRNKKET